MITVEGKIIEGFSINEAALIYGSLNDASGYPYEDTWRVRPAKVSFLFTGDQYDALLRKLNKFKFTNFQLEIGDLAIVVNALELLYYENGDFESLYGSVKKEFDITKEELKILIDKLKKI